MAQRNRRLNVFKNIQGKKVILIGKKDNLVNPKALAKLIKNTPIKLVELSEGHMSHIENKTDLSYFLKHFVEK